MNFEFSAEQEALRDQVRRLFDDHCPTSLVRSIMDGEALWAVDLWQRMAEMGLLGIAVPEAFGGLGLGYLELCVVAEEAGRALAPLPLLSSAYLATEFLRAAGSDAQKARLLPDMVAGRIIGTLALIEQAGAATAKSMACRVVDNRLTGRKIAVADGSIADFAVVAAHEEAGLSLWLADLSALGVSQTPAETIDPSRNHATLSFADVPVERLGAAGQASALIAPALSSPGLRTSNSAPSASRHSMTNPSS